MICEHQPSLLAQSVKHLKIHNPEYDPEFCPVNGKLTATYNGGFFTVVVQFSEVAVEVVTFEGLLMFKLNVNKPGTVSWHMIFYHVLQHTITHMMSVAINQRIYQSSCEEGTFYVH